MFWKFYFAFNEYHIIKSKNHFFNSSPYFLWQARSDNSCYKLNMKFETHAVVNQVYTKTYTKKNCL